MCQRAGQLEPELKGTAAHSGGGTPGGQRSTKHQKLEALWCCQLYQQQTNKLWPGCSVEQDSGRKRANPENLVQGYKCTVCTEATHCICDLLTMQDIPHGWGADCLMPGLEELRGYGIFEETKILWNHSKEVG